MFCSCATGGGSRLTAAAVRKVIYRPLMNELKQGWEERWGEKKKLDERGYVMQRGTSSVVGRGGPPCERVRSSGTFDVASHFTT
jgi:hypothetical protein